MKSKKALFAAGLLALTGLVSGCRIPTANYSESRTRGSIPERSTAALMDLANKDVKYSTKREQLNYADAQKMQSRYGNLPEVNFKVVYSDGHTIKVDSIDTTGPWNWKSVYDLEKHLENVGLDEGNYTALRIGPSDGRFVFPRAAKNQLSTYQGVLGIESDSAFTLEMQKIETPKDNMYEVSISFGATSVSQKLKDSGVRCTLETIASAGTSAAFGGPESAAGTAVYKTFNWLGALVSASRNVPDRTQIIRERKVISSLDDEASKTMGVLRNASGLGTKWLMVLENPSSTNYSGVVHSARLPRHYSFDGRTLKFETTAEEASFILSTLVDAAGHGIASGVVEATRDNNVSYSIPDNRSGGGITDWGNTSRPNNP